MNIFLVRLRRFKTNSILSIHVEAKDYLDACRFARNSLSDKSEWGTESYNVCECPDQPYTFTFNGIMIWQSHNFQDHTNEYIALYPGKYKAKKLKIKEDASVFDVKNFLKTLV